MMMMNGGGWGGPGLFLNITTEDVDDCCLVMCDRLMDLQAPKMQRHRPALNITLQHRYKNVHTCAYTYMHICIYTCIIYIDAFCHELKFFIKYLLKMTLPPPLSPFPFSLVEPVSLALPFYSQWVSCFECWESAVVI